MDVEFAHATSYNNIYMIAGALIAAIGSTCAGFLSSDKARKISAVVGAFGAVVGVLPKTLPDPNSIKQDIALHEKHKIVADKIYNQLELIEKSDLKSAYEKYIIARYTECASKNPSETFDPPPASRIVSNVTAQIPTQTGATGYSETAQYQLADPADARNP